MVVWGTLVWAVVEGMLIGLWGFKKNRRVSVLMVVVVKVVKLELMRRRRAGLRREGR